jgi:hypothetical protein
MEVSTRPHSSQHFDQKAQREARYRGYDIVMQRRDLCWMVTMKPSRPELPVFQRYSFQQLHNPNEKHWCKLSGAWTML